MEEEQKQKPAFLGKWIFLLFWLVVPSVLGEFLSTNYLSGMPRAVYITGDFIRLITAFSYALILLKMSSGEEVYRIPGICYFTQAASYALALTVFRGERDSFWSLLIILPALIVGVFGEYKEYSAHASVLVGIDHGLSVKWENLRKWYVGFTAAMLVGLLLVSVSAMLGGILAIVSSIGFLVARILKLIYLYRTAKAFGN